MGEVAYPQCIRELYETEILGEASFLALLDVAKNDRERYHFGTLLQLETKTKARLRPFLSKYGIDLSERMDLSDVQGFVAAYQQSAWPAFMRIIVPVVEGFHVRFQEIEAIALPEDQAMLKAMVTHEAVVLWWLEMEAAEKKEGSLDAIIGELNYTLPKPAGV